VHDTPYATVGGGYDNVAAEQGATVGGGETNVASGRYATVGGGETNAASGGYATVGGGSDNDASDSWSTIGGGRKNTASGYSSTVAGGDRNTASGYWSSVGGGNSCEASGDRSWAAGCRAIAAHECSFVWADRSSAGHAFSSTANNQFNARARGGVRFVTAIDGSGNPTAGVEVAAGGTGWSAISDRNHKENLQTVDGKVILARLVDIPIETWNLKSQHRSIRHIGPMAQDFAGAFEVGEDDRHINSVDADGVALAAIQGLYEFLKEKDARITAQEREIETLKARLAAIEERLADRD
jgi:hypothetical protein